MNFLKVLEFLDELCHPMISCGLYAVCYPVVHLSVFPPSSVIISGWWWCVWVGVVVMVVVVVRVRVREGDWCGCGVWVWVRVRQREEGRGQRAEGRGQRAEGSSARVGWLLRRREEAESCTRLLRAEA